MGRHNDVEPTLIRVRRNHTSRTTSKSPPTSASSTSASTSGSKSSTSVPTSSTTSTHAKLPKSVAKLVVKSSLTSSLAPTTKKKFRAEVVVKKKTTTTKSTTTIKTTTTSKEVKCSPRPVTFLKTHKTASTSLTNIILRYAEKNNFLVGLPPTRKWELGGYPAKFKPDLVDPQPSTQGFEVLAHHFRWSDEVEKVISKNAAKITVLRDPVKNFESGFGFFRDYPWPQWLGEKNRKVEDFLDNAEQMYDKNTPWHFRAKNYMAFDLGLDYERDDDQYIKEAIQTIESRFDLVLITDRFEESVILLKDMLCMKFDDITSLKLKVRRNGDRTSLDAKHEAAIRKWNKLDSALYDHFLTKLNDKIIKYGEEKMLEDLKTLQEQNEAHQKKCVDHYEQMPGNAWISRIIMKKNAPPKCNKMSWGEVKFGDDLRETQKLQLKRKRKLIQPKMEDLITRLKEEQIKILGKEAVENSK